MLPVATIAPAPLFDHGRRQPLREVKQRHRIDLEVPVEDLGIDVLEGAPRSAHGVVHQDRRRAHVAPQGGKRGVDLSFIRDVAGVGLGVLDIPLQRRQPLAIAGEHGDGVTAGGEPAHNRAARTWTDACDDGNGTIHVCIPSNGQFPYRPFKKDTYQIVRTHACLSFLEMPRLTKCEK